MKKINLPSDHGDFRNKVILGIGALRCTVFLIVTFIGIALRNIAHLIVSIPNVHSICILNWELESCVPQETPGQGVAMYAVFK